MKTQNLELANTSGYRAPELHQLGTLDKVQGWIGNAYDGFILYYPDDISWIWW